MHGRWVGDRLWWVSGVRKGVRCHPPPNPIISLCKWFRREMFAFSLKRIGPVLFGGVGNIVTGVTTVVVYTRQILVVRGKWHAE